MDMTHGAYWEDGPNTGAIQRIKFEGCNSADDLSRSKDDRNLYQCCDTNLNFSTATCSEDESEYGPYKKNHKVTRQDPMSHRIIEKRRRDRMNNCLADLSRLIPTEYLKKGRGRIEKTEIIEMAIKHMKHLQHEHGTPSEHYRMGYQECMSETMRFMVEIEGHFPREGICVRILSHLQKHCESLSRMNHHPPATNPIVNQIQSDVTANQESVINNNNNQVADHHHHTPKNEQNNNNTNGSFTLRTNNNDRHHHHDLLFDKHINEECLNGNSASYKYKTNIKMRFVQDLDEGVKRQKVENGRRTSVVSVENHSSSRSSPPTSEMCRISDHEHSRVSPADSTLSLNNLKVETNPAIVPPSLRTPLYSPPPVATLKPAEKGNFDVPVFVLHAKGAYYLPLTIDYRTLMPFLRNYDIFEMLPNVGGHVLHPVTINVNFQPNNNNNQFLNGKYKSELNNNWN